jgi:hypothetical protein
MGNMGIHNCKDCKLYKEQFCIGDKEPFFEDMWNKHDKNFPEVAKKLREIIDKKSRLQIKSERRKKTDNSGYPPKCYFAVLLYQTIKNEGKDPYSGLDIKWDDADKSGKHEDAPAIDHIDPDCKAPFNNVGELNLVFCRNDVNDAKNNLRLKDFINLCQIIADRKNQILSGISGLSQEN